MKIMISLPMNGISDAEVKEKTDSITKLLEKDGYIVMGSFVELRDYQMKMLGIAQIPVFYLAKSLEVMSRCDAVYFCKDWENARGCIIEHDVAVAYGLDILYEARSQEKHIL